MLFAVMQSVVLKKKNKNVARVFGYGLLPLVLGGFLAYYADMFIKKAWQIVPNILTLFGVDMGVKEFYLHAPTATSTFLHIIILGGMFASMYATYKICRRLEGETLRFKHLTLPFLVVLGFGIAYLTAI